MRTTHIPPMVPKIVLVSMPQPTQVRTLREFNFVPQQPKLVDTENLFWNWNEATPDADPADIDWNEIVSALVPNHTLIVWNRNPLTT